YPSQVDINAIISENLELFDDLIERKHIEFEIDLVGDNLGWIDENHLRIGVRNLIHNAIKFSESDSKVLITVQPDEDSILIEISDSGAGMTQEMIDSIRKKEVQKSKEGTEGEMGTGLGLSLSLGLLEKNSCILSIESKLGKGTTFRIWVPKFTSELS
ncbi:MAG: HAMP domain-containing sensor histidine kinase, partial [Bacteroidota bacterium]